MTGEYQVRRARCGGYFVYPPDDWGPIVHCWTVWGAKREIKRAIKKNRDGKVPGAIVYRKKP